MSTRHLPGFTGEEALYRSKIRYNMAARVRDGSEQAVLPQAVLDCLRSCYTEQNFLGPDLFDACRASCYHNQFVDDGGIRPAPGPARNTPPAPELLCYPCRNGKKLCGLPGQGFRSYPCFPE